jgi:hypothetical protein
MTGRRKGLIGLVAAVILGCGVAAGLAARVPDPLPATVAKAKPTPTPAVVQSVAAKPKVDEPFVVRRALQIDGPLGHGDWYWDDAGVPEGPVVITIDLTAQTLSVFRGGYEIGVAVILYGATDKPSPTGVFPITQKKVHHISNLYNAPMPYMMRLTNDGVAIHASDVKWGSATHGCIGVPTEFARRVFAQAALGTKVIITDGQMMQVGDRLGD